MEFVFDLMSTFVLYEYDDSRTDSMFGLATVSIYVDCFVKSVHSARRFLLSAG